VRMGIPRAGNDIGMKIVDRDLQRIWMIVLGVYLLNALLVVVNYQFVNALLFTVGGIVAAQQTQSRHALGN
jgi:hypothetical protein